MAPANEPPWWERAPAKPLGLLISICAGIVAVTLAVFQYGPAIERWSQSLFLTAAPSATPSSTNRAVGSAEPSPGATAPTVPPVGNLIVTFKAVNTDLRQAGDVDFVVVKTEKSGRYDVFLSFEPTAYTSEWVAGACTTVVSTDTVDTYRTQDCLEAENGLSLPLSVGLNHIKISVDYSGDRYAESLTVHLYKNGT